MGILKTHSHTSERLGYEAGKNAKKSSRRKRRNNKKANHRQTFPRTASVARGGRDEKGAMTRQNTVKKAPSCRQRGWWGDEEWRTERERSRYDKRNQRQNPPAGHHRDRGGGRDVKATSVMVQRWKAGNYHKNR